jgi:hypothetical protein
MFGEFELVPTIKEELKLDAFDEKTIKSPVGGTAGSRLASLGAVELSPIDICSAPGHESWASTLEIVAHADSTRANMRALE